MSSVASTSATATSGESRPDSTIETFAAVKLHIDTWLIRAGKKLPVTTAEVVVELQSPPLDPFSERLHLRNNYLRFRIFPDIVIALGLLSKRPGETMRGEEVELVLHFHPRDQLMAPYERLLEDAMRGDRSCSRARTRSRPLGALWIQSSTTTSTRRNTTQLAGAQPALIASPLTSADGMQPAPLAPTPAGTSRRPHSILQSEEFQLWRTRSRRSSPARWDS